MPILTPKSFAVELLDQCFDQCSTAFCLTQGLERACAVEWLVGLAVRELAHSGQTAGRQNTNIIAHSSQLGHKTVTATPQSGFTEPIASRRTISVVSARRQRSVVRLG